MCRNHSLNFYAKMFYDLGLKQLTRGSDSKRPVNQFVFLSSFNSYCIKHFFDDTST